MNKHNPDVLSCLANLSNDEVFTPPEIVNKMLDMLPQELFESSETTFLDPCCKTGVFLREIAKRLLKNQMLGYEKVIESINQKAENDEELSTDDLYFKKELQQTIDHIFHKQLFGIAITEMTSLVSRRSVYCSKSPHYKYSISHFDNAEGNIRFKRINHTWVNGKCKFCGANEEQYSRGESLETHAYEWIHTENPEGIFNMKFDVIISNPPYQLKTGGAQAQAIPLYHKFIMQAKKLLPRYIIMITPSRWFTGGFGLDSFRNEMLHDDRLDELHDFTNANDCFPGVEIKGGVSYFRWNKNYHGPCNIYSHQKEKILSYAQRNLLEPNCDVFIRDNGAISILRKVQCLQEKTMDSIASSQRPFGLATNFSDFLSKGKIKIYANKNEGYINKEKITKNIDLINKWKLLTPKAIGSGNYNDKVKPILAAPNSVCTETYIVLGSYPSKEYAKNAISYINTKFFHFLMGLKKNTQDALAKVYSFVPLQDFSKPWTDEELYKKYKFTQEEIDFIESMIRPMEKETA